VDKKARKSTWIEAPPELGRTRSPALSKCPTSRARLAGRQKSSAGGSETMGKEGQCLTKERMGRDQKQLIRGKMKRQENEDLATKTRV